jgi:hypothetical protein
MLVDSGFFSFFQFHPEGRRSVAVIHEEVTAEWLSPSQAARRLDISSNWVRKLSDRGTLRSVGTTLGRLINPSSVDELVRARQQRGGSPATGRQD